MFLFQVYSEYRASLAFDLVSSRQKNVRSCLLSDHWHSVNGVVPSHFINLGCNQCFFPVGLHRLQRLGCQEDGLYPSACGCFGKRGWNLVIQPPNMENVPLTHKLFEFSAIYLILIKHYFSFLQLIRVLMNSVKVQGALSYSCVFLFYLG